MATVFSNYLGEMMGRLSLANNQRQELDEQLAQAHAAEAAARAARAADLEAERAAHESALKALNDEYNPPGKPVERAKHAARRLASAIQGITGPGGPAGRDAVWGVLYDEVGKSDRKLRLEGKSRFGVASHDELAFDLANLRRRVSDVELPSLVQALRDRLRNSGKADETDEENLTAAAEDSSMEEGDEPGPLSAVPPSTCASKRKNRWVDPLTSLLPPYDADADQQLKFENARELYGVLESAVASKHWVREDKKMRRYLGIHENMRGAHYYPHGTASSNGKAVTKLTPEQVENKLAAREKKKKQQVLLVRAGLVRARRPPTAPCPSSTPRPFPPLAPAVPRL